MTRDSVGYGKPPKHSQFKPGTSGNASGRPKGRISFARLLERHLDAKMSATIGGQTKTITRREAIIFGLVGDALKGKDRVRKHIIELWLMLEAQNPSGTPSPPTDAQDEASILRFLHRNSRSKRVPVPAKSRKKAKIIDAVSLKEKSK